MSDDLARQVREDRTMRDQALALVKSDLDNLKSDYAHKSIKDRATDKIKTGANGVLDEAKEVASEHRGPLVALVAALVLWLARHPIMSLFSGRKSDEDDDEYRDDHIGSEHHAFGQRR